MLRPDELALIEHVRYAPMIFQEFVPGQADLRVTIVGREVFAAIVRTPTPGAPTPGARDRPGADALLTADFWAK